MIEFKTKEFFLADYWLYAEIIARFEQTYPELVPTEWNMLGCKELIFVFDTSRQGEEEWKKKLRLITETFRNSGKETKIQRWCISTQNYESKEVAILCLNTQWVGFTYFTGGGKHEYPEGYPEDFPFAHSNYFLKVNERGFSHV